MSRVECLLAAFGCQNTTDDPEVIQAVENDSCYWLCPECQPTEAQSLEPALPAQEPHPSAPQ